MIDQHLKLFASLNKEGVEYLLIGGTLAIAYGVPRVTKDIDLFIRPSLENAVKCLKALDKIKMGTAALTTPESLCRTEVTIFKDFVRVDVLTRVKGIQFDPSWKNGVDLVVERVAIHCLSLDDLIKSKKAAGRPGDIEDIKILKLARKNAVK